MKFKLFIFLSFFLCSLGNADLIDKYSQTLREASYATDNTLSGASNSVDPIVKNKNCSAFSKFAESVFKARQNGAKAEQVFSVIDTEDTDAKRVMHLIVADSFKYPILYSGKELNKAASEYANQFYIDCMI